MASYIALSGLGAFSNPIKNKRMPLRFVPRGCNMHIRKHQGATKTPIFPKSLLSLGMIEKRPKPGKGDITSHGRKPVVENTRRREPADKIDRPGIGW
jgi:hypothetical protein